MQEVRTSCPTLCLASLVALWCLSATDPATAQITVEGKLRCEALLDSRNLTLTEQKSLKIRRMDLPTAMCEASSVQQFTFMHNYRCPVTGTGAFFNGAMGARTEIWTLRTTVAEGYAVTNSNMGHDNGVEPGASFGFNNRQAEIDFGYRAVHLSVMAGKRLVRDYYGDNAEYSYFEGCSQGGRQAFMSAQRYPQDFDGIIAGAPAFNYQGLNAAGTWNLQRIFRDNLVGNLAADSTGDGSPDSLALLDKLHDRVLLKCDARDGVQDGVIGDRLRAISTHRSTFLI